MTNELSSPLFVDGIIKLHSKLKEAFDEATEIANKLLGFRVPKSVAPLSIRIFVDFGEQQSLARLKGYFMTKKHILRFLPIEFDTALLFPVHNHGSGWFTYGNGISLERLEKAKFRKEKLCIKFESIQDFSEPILFHSKILHPIFENPRMQEEFGPDEIGYPYFKFPDIDYLSVKDISSDILDRTYKLTDQKDYAPYSKQNNIKCVLFAQLNDKSNSNAVKVLRWFPSKKGAELDQLLESTKRGDIFFELGYVASPDNAALHAYMVSNHSRLLFGEVIDNHIIIHGGVKIFQTNDLKYPLCLYNIKLR